MTLLNPEEYHPLYEILKKNPLIQSNDPDDRRSLLHTCGVLMLQDKLQLGKASTPFLANLVTELENVEIQVRPGLILFLERYVMVYPADVDAEGGTLIQGIIGRWRAGGRTGDPAKPAPEEPDDGIRLEKSLMSGFDLESVVRPFRERLDDVSGVFGFSLGGTDQHMLEHYVMDRLMREYRDKTRNRTCRRIVFCTRPDDVSGGAAVIRREIRERLGCNARDWLRNKRNDGRDLIVCVWNRCLPTKEMGIIALGYMRHAAEKLAPHLEHKRLIVIWAGFEPLRIKGKGFTVLDLPPSVPANWLGWFQDLFKGMKLDDDRIGKLIGRLEKQNGALDGIYNEFRFIMEDLQGGYFA